MGVPCTYTEEMGAEICEVISKTPDGLKVLCERYAHWPDDQTIYTWLLKYPAFSSAYTRAKSSQVEVELDKVNTIIRDLKAYEHMDPVTGKISLDNGVINAAKLEIDFIKWKASKLKRKKYGDRIEDGEEEQKSTLNIHRVDAKCGTE